MKIQIPLFLTPEQRQELEQMTRSGNLAVRTLNRVRILLLTDKSIGNSYTDQQIADILLCNPNTVGCVRRRCLQEGVQAALYDKPRPGSAPKITGDIEAQLTVLACSNPPEGYARWTVRLLADKVVELGLVETIHYTTVATRLKKTKLSPGKSNLG